MTLTTIKHLTFCISVPIRGQADLLVTALASIAAQRGDVQIALMDASPDDSAQKVIDKYPELPIAYRRHGPDSGQAAAIQEGWDAVNGDIVSWLNADDYLAPGSLEVVERVFQSNPDVDVVYGDSVFVNRDGQFERYCPSTSANIADIISGCCVSQPACFVRRAAVERVGGLATKLHYIMDWDLWTRLYFKGSNFYYLRCPLAAIRMYRETKTSSGGWPRLLEINEHMKHHVPFVKRIRLLIAFAIESIVLQRKYFSSMLQVLVEKYRIIRTIPNCLFLKNRQMQLYGIEIHSNRVRAEAEIFLPWYREGRVSRVDLCARVKNATNIKATINGVGMSPVSMHTLGGGMRRIEFRVSGELSKCNLLKITFSTKVIEPWILSMVIVS